MNNELSIADLMAEFRLTRDQVARRLRNAKIVPVGFRTNPRARGGGRHSATYLRSTVEQLFRKPTTRPATPPPAPAASTLRKWADPSLDGITLAQIKEAYRTPAVDMYGWLRKKGVASIGFGPSQAKNHHPVVLYARAAIEALLGLPVAKPARIEMPAAIADEGTMTGTTRGLCLGHYCGAEVEKGKEYCGTCERAMGAPKTSWSSQHLDAASGCEGSTI